VRAAGLPVVAVPGPSAAVCALSVAGRSLPHVLFYGFLPSQAGARRRALEALASLPCALLFYEAPHRIRGALADMATVLGAGRTVTLARELTKMHEEVASCALGDAQAWLDASPHRERGEYVVIVEPAPEGADRAIPAETGRVLKLLLAELPASKAATLAARITGAPREELYAAALALKARA
jgi:16S rRNA (cytidine1402-2'-O)-methyltransferase